MSTSLRVTRVAITAGAALLLSGVLAVAPAHAFTAAQCAALTGLSVPSTTIQSAAVVAADEDLPEYCRVLGRVDTEINFELRLPTTRRRLVWETFNDRWPSAERGS